MDQLTAHLDRGWDLAAAGDARGAGAAARLALEIDPNAPEVHNLLGYAAALAGEAEQAVEHYRDALALDEGYFDAMLNAAEVLVHPLGQYDDAVAMCDEALTWAESDEEIADALLIKVEALLGRGDDETARRVLGMMPAGPFEHERYDFLIGRAYYDVGMVDHSAELIERTIEHDDRHADAHYYRGLIRDSRGDVTGATSSFLKVRLLDAEAPDPPWALPTASFERMVSQAIASLTPALRRFVEAAEVYVLPLPGLEVVSDGVDPRAPLLLDGLASPDRPGPPCARIFIYQRNFERAVVSAGELDEEIVHVLEHEITATFLEDRRSDGGSPRPKSKSELN